MGTGTGAQTPGAESTQTVERNDQDEGVGRGRGEREKGGSSSRHPQGSPTAVHTPSVEARKRAVSSGIEAQLAKEGHSTLDPDAYDTVGEAAKAVVAGLASFETPNKGQGPLRRASLDDPQVLRLNELDDKLDGMNHWGSDARGSPRARRHGRSKLDSIDQARMESSERLFERLGKLREQQIELALEHAKIEDMLAKEESKIASNDTQRGPRRLTEASRETSSSKAKFERQYREREQGLKTLMQKLAAFSKSMKEFNGMNSFDGAVNAAEAWSTKGSSNSVNPSPVSDRKDAIFAVSDMDRVERQTSLSSPAS